MQIDHSFARTLATALSCGRERPWHNDDPSGRLAPPGTLRHGHGTQPRDDDEAGAADAGHRIAVIC
jgi:hypothetical protein